jgi:hypothetical protein
VRKSTTILCHAVADAIFFCIIHRALYIQELLLGTVEENSQNVISSMLQDMSMVPNEAVEALQFIDSSELGAQAQAQAPPQQQPLQLGGGAEAMKKSFMRKKEMVDEGGKKQQKAKVASARK